VGLERLDREAERWDRPEASPDSKQRAALLREAAELIRQGEELLREWKLLGNLPGGGFGGTLEARTDAWLPDEEPS
jgi:hypothetical protein